MSSETVTAELNGLFAAEFEAERATVDEFVFDYLVNFLVDMYDTESAIDAEEFCDVMIDYVEDLDQKPNVRDTLTKFAERLGGVLDGSIPPINDGEQEQSNESEPEASESDCEAEPTEATNSAECTGETRVEEWPSLSTAATTQQLEQEKADRAFAHELQAQMNGKDAKSGPAERGVQITFDTAVKPKRKRGKRGSGKTKAGGGGGGSTPENNENDEPDTVGLGTLIDMFPDNSEEWLRLTLLQCEGSVEAAAARVLSAVEVGTAVPKTGLVRLDSKDEGEIVAASDNLTEEEREAQRREIVARYALKTVDDRRSDELPKRKTSNKKAPVIIPGAEKEKRLVRYRDGVVVSTKGERYMKDKPKEIDPSTVVKLKHRSKGKRGAGAS